eukprot:1539752-Rhodomonas_salina.5
MATRVHCRARSGPRIGLRRARDGEGASTCGARVSMVLLQACAAGCAVCGADIGDGAWRSAA